MSPSHRVSSSFWGQLTPAPPSLSIEPMAILTAVQTDTPFPLQGAKHPPTGKQEYFPPWGQSLQRRLNSPWEGIPLEGPQTPGFHSVETQHN